MNRFQLKLMFEWGGGCLWCDNTAAREEFGVGPIEGKLRLSDEVIERLHQLTDLHDTALDWSDPAGPSPWTDAQFVEFDDLANAVLTDVQDELGNKFVVSYQPLGAG